MNTYRPTTAPRLALLLGLSAISVAAGPIAVQGQVMAPVAEGAAIMPVDEVQVGMTGVGYTVVHGAVPEAFDVEILGVLENAFPKHDLIVGRLRGLGLERSGAIDLIDETA